ncbi:MAG: TetR/AcrR family transcriptional regulator [Pseudomonadota bacterium]
MTDTRERFLDAATAAFAERGFYGTSIATIVETLPFTKQALLHHFGSKEKLYGEVLKRISDRLRREVNLAVENRDDPRERLETTLLDILDSAMAHDADTMLLMRELLDNKRRAGAARAWYLKPFLELLTDMVQSVPASGFPSRHAALSFVYQMLGAINYFVVSEPTLTQMYGKRDFMKLRECYAQELKRLISARLED